MVERHDRCITTMHGMEERGEGGMRLGNEGIFVRQRKMGGKAYACPAVTNWRGSDGTSSATELEHKLEDGRRTQSRRKRTGAVPVPLPRVG